MSSAGLASVAVAAGVSLGMRRPVTGSSHPSSEQVPCQVSRPGSEVASVVWPALQVPRTRTPFFGLLTAVDGKPQLEVHSCVRGVFDHVSPVHHRRHTMAQVLADLTPRLEKAAAAIRDAKVAYDLQVKLRDELVVQAVEEGMYQRAIAQAAGLKSSNSITRILAASHAEDD